MSVAHTYLAKASESLAGAESELREDRFNSSANRSYYACFQAAIAGLLLSGSPKPISGRWSHGYVQSELSGQLIARRKQYPSEHRDTLMRNLELRHVADYEAIDVTEIAAQRAYQRARAFVQSVTAKSERRR